MEGVIYHHNTANHHTPQHYTTHHITAQHTYITTMSNVLETNPARTIGKPTAETLALCRLLRTIPAGGVVTYEQMADAIGCTADEVRNERRSVYYSARNILLRDDRVWFDCQIGVGYKRLDNREMTEMWPHEACAIRNRAKKAADVVSAANFESLNPVETRAALTGLAIMGAVSMFVTPKAQKQIESKISDSGNVALNSEDTLALFRTKA